MNRTTWKQLASGLLAATLSLGIAACDDDTSSGTGDMAMGGDMSAEAGMPDMTGTPGNGQITLADVVGTLFVPTSVSASRCRVRTPCLRIASFPKPSRSGDPSSDLTLTPPQRLIDQSLQRDQHAGHRRRRGRHHDRRLQHDVRRSASNGAKAAVSSPMAGSSPITCKLRRDVDALRLRVQRYGEPRLARRARRPATSSSRSSRSTCGVNQPLAGYPSSTTCRRRSAAGRTARRRASRA